MPSPLFGIAQLVALLTTASPAPMPPPRAVDMEWNPTPGCPSAVEVHEDLQRLSGGAMRVVAGGDARVTATVRPDPEGYGLALVVHDGPRRERRTLHAPDCRTLADATALLTVVTLGSTPVVTELATRPRSSASERSAGSRDLTPPSPAPSVAAEPEPTSELPRTPAGRRVTPANPPSPPPRDRARLAAFVGPAFASTPGPTAVVGGAVGWERGLAALEVTGWHAFATERAIEAGVGVRASLSGGGLRASASFTTGPVAIPVSLGIEAGVLSGTGVGDRVVGSDSRSPWLAGTMGAGLRWPARSPLALRVSADAVLTALRPGIHLRRAGTIQEVFVVPPVGARALVGLTWRPTRRPRAARPASPRR